MAYYLATAVGEGNTFTMQAVRDACPGISQVDRRMRELRELGWVIHTYKDSASLQPEQLRLVRIGDRVWEPDYKPLVAGTRIPGPLRREVLERDHHRCTVCGIGAGEEYPDYPGRRARMTIGHVQPIGRGGRTEKKNLRTECAMCNETAKDTTSSPTDPTLVMRRIRELPRKEKAILAQWMSADQRDFSELEDVWAEYRSLPAANREVLRAYLDGILGD